MLSNSQREQIKLLKANVGEGADRFYVLADHLERALEEDNYAEAHRIMHEFQMGVALLHDAVKFLQDVQITEQTSLN